MGASRRAGRLSAGPGRREPDSRLRSGAQASRPPDQGRAASCTLDSARARPPRPDVGTLRGQSHLAQPSPGRRSSRDRVAVGGWAVARLGSVVHRRFRVKSRPMGLLRLPPDRDRTELKDHPGVAARTVRGEPRIPKWLRPSRRVKSASHRGPAQLVDRELDVCRFEAAHQAAEGDPHASPRRCRHVASTLPTIGLTP